MNRKEILIRAKRILQKDGWVQGIHHDVDGHCALGAIQIASHADSNMQDYLEAASTLQSQISCKRSCSVTAHNDHPSTTYADVLSWFDRAIEACR